jgi:putative thioredoxin
MSYDLVSFEDQVIERSRSVPVLVDFWAEWCGPCQMFGPILEKAADGAGGRWELVKVDTERHPELAARFRVRSLPTIRLFVGGEAVAESLGALSEASLGQWLDRHLPSPRAAELDGAEAALAGGDYGRARDLASAVLAEEPRNDRARYLRALAALATDPGEVAGDADAIAAGSPFFDKAEPLKDLARLRLEPPRDPGKGAETCVAALSALARLDWDGACESFLALLERDRHYGKDVAARGLKQVFLLLGPRDPVTARHQPRFASLLFS